MNIFPVAGFWRRLAAVIYDGLILVALLMLAAALATLVVELATPGLNARQPDTLRQHPAYLLWLMLWWFGYYAWCWRKGGQTVGMKAWRLKLVSRLHHEPTTWQLTVRLLTAGFLAAVLLAGYKLLEAYGLKAYGQWLFALLVTLQLPALAVQEKLSNTAVQLLPKPSKTAKQS